MSDPFLQIAEVTVELIVDHLIDHALRFAELALEHFAPTETGQQRLGIGNKGTGCGGVARNYI